MTLRQSPQPALRRRFVVGVVVLFVGAESLIFAWEYQRNLGYQRVTAAIVGVTELARRRRLALRFEMRGTVHNSQTDVSFLDRRSVGDRIDVLVEGRTVEDVFLDEFMYRHQLSFGLAVAAGFLGLIAVISMRRMARIRADFAQGAR